MFAAMGANMKPIDIARRELEEGVSEATGHDDGVPAARYNDGEPKAWCAAFVRFCFEKAGSPLPGLRHMLPSVAYMERGLETMKARVAEPFPGAIITFRWDNGGRHVGLVEEVATIGTPERGPIRRVVRTIEGNTANAVRRRTYPIDSRVITGFFKWPR